MTFKKWEKDWFDVCKETAADRHQWRGLVQDIVAGRGQHCLESIIWKQKKIPRNIKKKVFNACVKKILLYGNETWPINKSDVKNCKFSKRDAFKKSTVIINHNQDDHQTSQPLPASRIQ